MAIGTIKFPILHPIKIKEVAKLIVFFVVILSKLLKIYGKHHAPGMLDKNKSRSKSTILPLDIAIRRFEAMKKPIPKYIVIFPKIRLTKPNTNPAAIPNIGIKAR